MYAFKAPDSHIDNLTSITYRCTESKLSTKWHKHADRAAGRKLDRWMEGWKVTSRERQTQINIYRDELTDWDREHTSPRRKTDLFCQCGDATESWAITTPRLRGMHMTWTAHAHIQKIETCAEISMCALWYVSVLWYQDVKRFCRSFICLKPNLKCIIITNEHMFASPT